MKAHCSALSARQASSMQRISPGTIAKAVIGIIVPTVAGMMIPQIGLRLGIATIAVSVAIAAGDIVWMSTTRKMRGNRLAAIILVVVGVLALGGGIYLALPKQSDGAETPQAPSVKSRLLIECNTEPTVSLSVSDAYIMMPKPVPAEANSGGLTIVKTSGSSKVTFPGGPLTERCVVRNYGPQTIAALELAISVKFRESIVSRSSDGKGMGVASGKETLVRPWVIKIPRLDPGPNNGFEFYIVNGTDQFLTVEFPESATGIGMDTGKAEILAVTHDAPKGKVITPFIP